MQRVLHSSRLPGLHRRLQLSVLRAQGLHSATPAHTCQAPAVVGLRVSEVDTPALLLDLDVFEANCAQLRSTMSQHPSVAIRPHAKAHKCPELAALQLRLLGPQAWGVCCQTVREAEAMVAGGVSDVFVSNEVTAAGKMRRLVALAAQHGSRVGVCVDDAGNAAALAAEAARQSTTLDAVVEVNAGQDRCGVDTPEEAARLALRCAQLGPHLRFAGIQAYHGGLQHVRKPADRAAAVAKVVARATAAVDAITAAGLPVALVTGGGSGTYRHEAASGVFTEVQPGSFAFGDADYARNQQDDGSIGEWRQALWVATTVVSRSASRAMVVVDAGLKALSLDSGPPVLPPSATAGVRVEYQSGGDEHGKLLWPQGVHQMPPPELPALGAVLRLQPGHCDPTVNMYDWMLGVRGDVVEEVFQVAARGPGS